MPKDDDVSSPPTGDQPHSSSEVNSSDEEILALARKRFALVAEAESEYRRLATEDMAFLAGDQWPIETMMERERDKRPCLTINRLPQFKNQITNDQRQNRPSIKVSPVDSKADVETAKVYQGMVRHIEYASNADVAYDRAFEGAVGLGRGFFRIVNEYTNPLSFDQEPRIKSILNPLSVYIDPFFQEPDGSDMGWGFIVDDLSPEEYAEQFPGSKLASGTEWIATGNELNSWVSEAGYRVAEYYYKSSKRVEIALLSNGQVVPVKDLKEDVLQAQNITIQDRRTTTVPEITHCKINGFEILERTTWPGRWIPIIPVLGAEVLVNGKRTFEGIIRHAKDPQRMLNYWTSAETEAIALAPKAPWIGYQGQFEGHEKKWETANIKSHAYLEVKPVSIGGMPAPLPQRNVFEPAVQAITQARMLASEDLKATTGIFDASLGGKSNETSGIAIQRRNNQAQTSNFHFVDNLSRSIRHGGRILVDDIPHVFDTPRAIRTLGEDGTVDVVRVNEMFEKGGKQIAYRLGVGEYDVTVSTGPSFNTKRQEAAAMMAEITQAYPQLMDVAGDLMIRNMDIPGAEEIAERLKKTLPPGLADDPNKEKAEVPPEAQAQMQQMGQLIDQLTGKLNDAQDKLDTKILELESKERIEFKKMEVDLQKLAFTMDSKESMFAYEQQLADINRRLELLKVESPIEDTDVGGEMLPAPIQEKQPLTGELPPGTSMEE